MNEVRLKRRSLSGQLRYLAGKLREGDRERGIVALALEVIADEAETTTLPHADLGQLLAVATLYVDAFREDEMMTMMTLPEKLRLQEVEAILERHGRRY